MRIKLKHLPYVENGYSFNCFGMFKVHVTLKKMSNTILVLKKKH